MCLDVDFLPIFTTSQTVIYTFTVRRFRCNCLHDFMLIIEELISFKCRSISFVRINHFIRLPATAMHGPSTLGGKETVHAISDFLYALQKILVTQHKPNEAKYRLRQTCVLSINDGILMGVEVNSV